MSDKVNFSIILPCYNEAANLPALLESYAKVWIDLPSELILVNNGSTDNTDEVLSELLKLSKYKFVRVVTVKENKGYGFGIVSGLKQAIGEILSFSHADMQCAPGDLFKAYKLLLNQNNPEKTFIKGNRMGRKSILTAGMSIFSSSLLLCNLTDVNAQPKLFSKIFFQELMYCPDGFELDLYLLYKARKAGLHVQTLPVQYKKRVHGQSKWAFNFTSRFKTIFSFVKYIFILAFAGERQAKFF